MNASAPFSVCVATARAAGAVAVIEVRGPGALAAVRRLANASTLTAGRVVLARLVDDGEQLDEALLVVCDDGVDVCLHGGVAVVERCVRALGGETLLPPATTWSQVATRRLPFAVSEAGARILLDQSEGALERALAELATAPAAAARARELAELGRAAQPYLLPPRVVLAGPVNAGKSTLFNVLAGRERVLASPLAGTTRDAVRELVQGGDLVIELVDTAGRRALERSATGERDDALDRPDGPFVADDVNEESASARERAERPYEVAPDAHALERAGQRLGARVARAADLVLWCSPADAPAPVPREFVGARVVSLVTRADLVSAVGETLGVSAATDVQAARRVVWRAIGAALRLVAAPWQSGRAVAFDERLAARLEHVAIGGDDAVRRASLAGAFTPAAVLTDGHASEQRAFDGRAPRT
jgi:hypothetical protein